MIRSVSAWALAGALVWGLLTIWIPGAWAAHALEAGVLALGMAWALAKASGPSRLELRGHALLAPLLAIPAWIALQLALGVSVYPFATGKALFHWTAIAAAVFVGLQAFAEDRLRERVRMGLVGFAAALGAVSVVQLFLAGGKAAWLVPAAYEELVLGGPHLYRNNYAAFIEMMLPMALLAAWSDPPRRLLWAGASAVMYASVVAAGSRTGALLVTAELLLAPLLAWRRGVASREGRGATALLLAVCIAAGVAVVGVDGLWAKMARPDLFEVRREFLQSSLVMWRERPWAGFGLGTWPYVYPAYAVFDDGLYANQAHNDWAQWGVEGGAPMFLLLLIVAGISLQAAWRTVWGLGVAAVFVHALVDYPFARLGLALWPFVLLAMAVASQPQLSRKRRRQMAGFAGALQ